MDYFIARVFHRLKLLWHFNLKIKRKVNGTSINVPVIHGLGYDNLNVTELWMTQVLKLLLTHYHGTFVDVGINVGQTLIKLKTVQPDADYIGFEPNPTCIYYVNTLVAANGFSDCRIYPVGLGSENAILQLNLYTETETDSAASLVEDFRPQEKIYRRMYVPVYTFEAVSKTANLKNISIVKIDVEGAELEVLQGLQVVLSTLRPAIVMEILPAYSTDNKTRVNRQQMIEDLLRAVNYNIYRIIKSKNHVEKFDKLDSIGVHSNREWCEYLMLPSEKSAILKANER
jgi:FkbM family methyltransferase